MKKSLKVLGMSIVATIMFASCATTTPITATSNPVGNKCGEATATKVLGLFGGSDNIGINKAAKSETGLSQYYGSLGCVLLVVGIASLVLAIQSNMEEESFKLFPHIATILSILVILCWAGTYISGLM